MYIILHHRYTSQLWAKALQFVCALFVNCSSNNCNWLVLAKQHHIARQTSLRQNMCILTLHVTDGSSTEQYLLSKHTHTKTCYSTPFNKDLIMVSIYYSDCFYNYRRIIMRMSWAQAHL